MARKPTASPEHHLGAEVASAIKTLGLVIGVVGAGLAAVRGYADFDSTTRRDLRDQVSAAVRFYSDAADRAVRLNAMATPSRGDLLLASYKQVMDQPPPTLGGTILDPLLQKNIKAGYTEICESRQYSIDTHLAAADPSTKASLAVASQAGAASTLTSGQFALRCGDLVIASAASGIDSLTSATPLTILSKKPAANGWDIDAVFCAGQANLDMARKIGEALATEGDAGHSVGGQRIGRVRTRLGTGTTSNAVYYDPAEAAFANSLASYATRLTGAAFAIQKNAGQPTPFYVSLFVCGQK